MFRSEMKHSAGDASGGRAVTPRELQGGSPAQIRSKTDQRTDPAGSEPATERACVSDGGSKRKPPLTSAANGGQQQRVMGLEPSTFSLEGCGEPLANARPIKSLGVSQKRVAPPVAPNCSETAHDDPDQAKVAAAWPQLPRHIRAAILTLVESSIPPNDDGAS